MRPLFVAFLLLGSACSASLDPKTDGADGTGSDFPGNGGSGSGGGDGSDAGSGNGGNNGNIDDLDDIKSDMVTSADGCQTIDEEPPPGAASYFYGELEPGSNEAVWEPVSAGAHEVERCR